MGDDAGFGGRAAHGSTIPRPKGVLLDYGGTLVEEAGFDPRAGNVWLLGQASAVAPGLTMDAVLERAHRVAHEVADRRDKFGIEAPWASLTRLIHDYFGTRFSVPMAELERGFWDAAVTTLPIPGAHAALAAVAAAGVPMAVLSNASFGADVIRHDLAKHGLADHLAFVMVTADYVVRKPSALLLEVAAARLGVGASDIWVVGDRLDTDIAGARAAGMRGVWLKPPNVPPSPLPDLTVRDWSEFRACFAAAVQLA
jgi:FMN phosphatase YigB (HAD superfamily)